VRKLIILIAGVMVPAILTAQLSQQWAATYYTSGGGGVDSAQAVALDADGNIYVAGTSDCGVGAQADYVTIKYDPDGKMLWTAIYRGAGRGPDRARDIAVDASGVYVFGRSYTPTGYEYATVKYSMAGAELWVAKYKTAENATMDAAGLELDPDGNVLVTGSGKGPDGSLDYATVKYSPGGTELWDVLYDGPGANSRDTATAIAVDASGNICVTGYTGTGYATVVYDADGAILGSATYDPAGAAAVARDVAPDGAGNFVVTGYRTDGKYLTIKYEPDGDKVWDVSHGSGGALAEAIAVGSDGDVYVTGSEYQWCGTQVTTVKYNSSGEQQWVVRSYFGSYEYSAQDKPFDIALDASGNVYVAGYAIAGDYDRWYLAYVKYGHDGVELWKRVGSDWGIDPTIGARMIAIDPSGDVVATGRNSGSRVTTKYSSTGDLDWIVRYNYPLAGTDVGKKVAFDGTGNAYVLVNGSLIIKYSRSGAEESVCPFPGEAVAIAIDAAGNAYVAGSDYGSHLVAVKYSPTGDQLWVRYYDGPGGYMPHNYACGIALDASGNVYVGGTLYDYATDKAYLAAVKYNSAGEEQWSGLWLAVEGSHGVELQGTGLAVDGSGRVLVCGNYYDDYGYHAATVKFSGGPGEAWARTLDNVTLLGIAADPSGNSYVFSSTSVMKYDAEGTVCWTQTPSVSIKAVMTDAAGNLYVIGSACRLGSYDFATVKYSTAGDVLWERFYDGGSDDYPTAIALAGNANVYVTGYSKGTGGYNDYATAGYTSGGDLLGSARYDGPAGMDDQAWSVATGPGGRVCVTGQATVVGQGYDAATVMYFPEAGMSYDVGVTKIIEPSGVIDTLTETPKATVYNYGKPAPSFDVWFEIRDEAATSAVVYRGSATVTNLATDESRDVSFPDWLVPRHQDGRYYAKSWTALVGDVYAQNDMAASDFAVEGKQQEPPFWTAWPDVPAGPQNRVVQHGAAMATDPMGLFVYLLKGNNTREFYRYDPATRIWSTLDPIPEKGRDNTPRNVKEGGTLAQVGGKFYATKGGNSPEFWEYDPVATSGSRWTQKADVPGTKGVSNGAGATGVQYGPHCNVYLLKASETFEFYAYDVDYDYWWACADAPGDKNKKWAEGSCVTSNGVDTLYALKGEHSEFYAYVVSTGTWLAKQDLPLGPKNKKAKGGAAICYHLRNVYCIKGSNSQEFWVYNCNAGTWAQGPDVTLGPRKTRVQDGGALVYCRNSRYLFATKGNCLEFWSYGRLSNFTGPMEAASVPTPIQFSLVVSSSVTNSRARVSYALPKAGDTRLRLFDVTGRCAAVLRDGWCEPGRYAATVDASRLARGVYIVKLESDAGNLTRKVVIE